MAAYRRVYDSRHLQADCQEPRSAPEPYARQSSMGYLYLTFIIIIIIIIIIKATRSSAIAEGPRDASCQLKSCQLPRNSAETTYTTSPDQIDGMKLEI